MTWSLAFVISIGICSTIGALVILWGLLAVFCFLRDEYVTRRARR